MHKTGTTKITSVLNTMKRTVLEDSPCSAQAQCINGHYLYIMPVQRLHGDSSRTVLFKADIICD